MEKGKVTENRLHAPRHVSADRDRETGGTKRSKYNNIKIGGYDSMKERRRARALQLMERAGLISGLEEQVKFTLIDEQRDPRTGKVLERACVYVADFTYHDNKGRYVVEDVKGVRTEVYRIKRKLMLSRYGIRITET